MLKRPIVVALSGGVDSSVVAALLKAPETTLLYMTNWNRENDDSLDSTCSQDLRDARKVAQHLQLPLVETNFEQEYWHTVFEPYLEQLTSMRVGNPDVDCNRNIKFGVLREYVKERFGSETLLATGHYARLSSRDEFQKSSERQDNHSQWILDWGDAQDPFLLSAVDTTKDQSYFLSTTASSQFRNVTFPLGNYHKRNETRSIAHQYGLPTTEKRESMGICFIGKRKNGFNDFMSHYLPPRKPRILVDIETQRTVGESTAPVFAIGQKMRIGGAPRKFYCVSYTEDVVYICDDTHHPALYSDSLTVQTMYWTMRTPPIPLLRDGHLRAQCRIRHLQPLIDCTVYERDGMIEIEFDKQVRGIAPGQMAVLYSGVVCLGGGVIHRSGESYFEQGIPVESMAPSGLNDLSVMGN